MTTTKDVLYLYYKYSTPKRRILLVYKIIGISALGHDLIALANDSAVSKINETLQHYDESNRN